MNESRLIWRSHEIAKVQYEFTLWVTMGRILQGWALAEQGQGEEGIAHMLQGLSTLRATGTELARPYFLAQLAEGYRKEGQAEEGLTTVGEALTVVRRTGERLCEAELWRLKGTLVLQSAVKTSLGQVSGKSQASQDLSKVPSTQHLTPSTHAEAEAEACFQKALEIARKQQAKSLELRAATSLAQLWQHQGKRKQAHKLLAPIYNWFTEGFDTADLKEAKEVLEALGRISMRR
jgi:predicted ATPase